MFVVYWLEDPAAGPETGLEACSGNAPRRAAARFERFGDSELTQALAFAEDLRKRQAAGEDVSFVSLCSENPHSVGRAGVADPPADYVWTKRRR
ncbi:hypothetical protein [Paraburkholderia rhizosphaerae]|uniref:Uncharacterized protein n=1 Tax=Paraburkholderia rhizosphaerae TaxID=480658 RepID=A0A4R8LXV6_9BURK|nr:hypothetical protein [Paraburkholderia rhizosphaerae]TDY51627.1 hypothetical protein BX592_107195 [Paraburkholderia rhizosphaerae]